MLDGKSIVFAAGIALAAMALATGASFCSAADARDARPYQTAVAGRQPYLVVQTDAHKPVTYHFAVTNTTDKPQTVESVRSSCACLKVLVGSRVPRDRDGRAVSTKPPTTAASSRPPYQAIPPGGVLPFEVEFNPAGMEGRVEKRVWVTLAPIGGSPGTARPTRIVTFDIAADVRLRLGFKPMDAAFGVIKRSDTGREIVAKLSGYVANGVTLGEPFIKRRDAEAQRNAELLSLRGDSEARSLREKSPCLQNSKTPSSESTQSSSLRLCASALKNQSAVFEVRLGADGKSIVAKFRDRNVLPGIYSETWTIPTSDKEIPEITFAVSARVADAVSVTPQVITVGWDEPVCSRMVMIRTVGSRVPRDRSMRILSAETKPRKWGDVKITPRPLNGWRIDIENIDPREVRQFSKRPFLEVKTNLPGMESFEIPLRVMQNGGTE